MKISSVVENDMVSSVHSMNESVNSHVCVKLTSRRNKTRRKTHSYINILGRQTASTKGI
jgi:hypothetical protein